MFVNSLKVTLEYSSTAGVLLVMRSYLSSRWALIVSLNPCVESRLEFET